MADQLKHAEVKIKLLNQQIDELQIEIDRIKFSNADQSSFNNVSLMSNNQQLVSELESKVQLLEHENDLLKSTKSDTIHQRSIQLEQELYEKSLVADNLAKNIERLQGTVSSLQTEKEQWITQKLEGDHSNAPQMLSLVRSERDQLLKKNAKAKERLLDLDQLKKDKVELEFKLKDITNQLIEKADKIKEL